MRTVPWGVPKSTAMRPDSSTSLSQVMLPSSSGESMDPPSQVATLSRSPASSQPSMEITAGPMREGWSSGGLVHWVKYGRAGSSMQVVEPDLAPGQVVPVRPDAVALDGGPPEPCLDGRQVVDRDDPAEPATAELGAPADRLTEGRSLGRRVVEGRDDLEVDPVLEREDEVAGAESRVPAAVGEGRAEGGSQTLDGVRELTGRDCVGDVVETHAGHPAPTPRGPLTRGTHHHVRRVDAPAGPVVVLRGSGR